MFAGRTKHLDDILRFTDIAWKGDGVIESGGRSFSSLDGQIVDEKQTAGFDHSFTYATAHAVAPTPSHQNRFSGQIQRHAPSLEFIDIEIAQHAREDKRLDAFRIVGTRPHEI